VEAAAASLLLSEHLRTGLSFQDNRIKVAKPLMNRSSKARILRSTVLSFRVEMADMRFQNRTYDEWMSVLKKTDDTNTRELCPDILAKGKDVKNLTYDSIRVGIPTAAAASLSLHSGIMKNALFSLCLAPEMRCSLGDLC
jgi:hypothetical protein